MFSDEEIVKILNELVDLVIVEMFYIFVENEKDLEWMDLSNLKYD